MSIFKKSIMAGLIAIILVSIAACDNRRLTGTSYVRGEVREAQTLRRGVVVDIAQVTIEPNQTGAGGAVGGLIGGIAAGNTNGHGAKQIIQVVSIILGGLAGEYIERRALTKGGLEIVIDLEDGSSVSIVQETDKENPFTVGDQIRLVENGKTLRVVKVGFPL